jgi:hypothetical protein
MAAACVIAVPLALAACTNSPGAKVSGGTTTSKSHAKATIVTDPRFTVTNNVAARRDVALTSCHAGVGGWIASGTVTNPTSGAATYTLQVTYTDTHATVLGVEKTSVPTAPKQSLTWTTTWPSSMTAGVVCVVEAVSRS